MPGQAKCPKCRIRFVWDPYYLPEDIDARTRMIITKRVKNNKSGRSIVKETMDKLACPHCRTALEATSHLSKLTISPELPVYREGAKKKHREFPPEYRKRSLK